MFQLILKWLTYWALQYELVTCINMFEPWERRFINGSIFAILALVCYSSYVYLPQYAASLLGINETYTGTSIDQISRGLHEALSH